MEGRSSARYGFARLAATDDRKYQQLLRRSPLKRTERSHRSGFVSRDSASDRSLRPLELTGVKIMDELTRRTLLAAAAAGGLITAATAAGAQTGEGVPQPQRPGHGGTDPCPRNLVRDRQNPDLLVPPSTDHGTLPNLRCSFSDSHMRQESGGWTRQVTVRELGISKGIAEVNMRLNAGGVRELHWHRAAEWAYMLYGASALLPNFVRS
jgi:hypothetical protein